MPCAGEAICGAFELRRVKKYSMLYDDVKGFVSPKMPASYDGVLDLLSNIKRALAFVDDLIMRDLRCNHHNRYGWREEYTLCKFHGGSERLKLIALALRWTLSHAFEVSRIEYPVQRCAASRHPKLPS